MGYNEDAIRRLLDEIIVMKNGIEILECIEERNNCDSHTIDAIAAFLKQYRRFKKTQKLKQTLDAKKRSQELRRRKPVKEGNQ